jgi:hypothetical protein
VPGVGF